MNSQQQHSHLARPAHKEPPAHAPNAALMIDFDNVTMAIRSDLQTELKRLLQSEIIRGKVAVQRAYADWRRYPQYIVPLSESSIDLIFAPAHGANKKNATDIRLAIDALELVFTRPEIGTFILLSGDSDFSSLVLKLKEYGKYVIGVGIRESSSDLLIQNCDEYYSYNELAGFTKASDVEYVKRDPWELVVEAVKQMTAHNDVMRSDRLKQVMQEIDPNFDEKDAGFSRFSKFVIDAAHKGLITLTRLDNGQYEIALGPQVAGAPAAPSLAASSAAERGGPRADRPRGRGGRGRGRGRGRAREQEDIAPAAPAAEPEPAPPEAPAARSGFSFGDAFGLLKQAIGRIGMDERPASAQELRDAMAELPQAPAKLETEEVQQLLREAQEKDMIELERDPEGYTVKMRTDTDTPRSVFPVPSSDIEEEDDIPMPASSAPPPPYSTPSQPARGVPARGAGGRFRRGSRGGGRPGQGTPDIPKIGVVEVDPNFRPRIEPPASRAPVQSASPQGDAPRPSIERSERGERDRGERGTGGGGGGGGGGSPRGGRGGRGRDRTAARSGEERGERGRSRRGGRGRSGGGGGTGGGGRGRAEGGAGPGPRRYESDNGGGMNETPVQPAAATSSPPPAPPVSKPAPVPQQDAEPGESFWSKVKRGLTGGV
jgi:uncharacterized protein (TIGR00288 family)